MEACRFGAPGAESQCLIVCCLFSFLVSGSQRTFCPLPFLDCALGRHMSRGDALRQLAAQLSVLAALEDTIAVGFSSVMGPASPGRGAASPVSSSPLASAAPAASAASAPAPSPSHEVAASLLRSASLRPPLPGRALALAHLRLCRNALHGRHVAAPASPLVCVALLPSRSRDWSRAWPPRVAHQSRLPNCVSHVSLVPSTLLRQSLSPPAVAPGSSVPTAPAPEAPRVTEPSSNSDDEWDALLDAHGLTGTAAAVAQPAVAAGARRRARDKRRRRQRKASKRSMWRDI